MKKSKATLRQRYDYYCQQNAHQHLNQQNFQNDFPSFAYWLDQKKQSVTTDQNNTFSHWLLLALFGMMTAATLTQQLLFILLFLGLAALIKGPGMILLGILYSILVSFFPPLGILFSALIFFFSLQQLTKNLSFVLTAVFFYGYPFAIKILRSYTDFDSHWLLIGAIALGLVSFHFLLQRHYQQQISSKAFAWALICVPYDFLLALWPQKKWKKNARFSPK